MYEYFKTILTFLVENKSLQITISLFKYSNFISLVLQVNILLLNYSNSIFHIINLEPRDPKFMVVFLFFFSLITYHPFQGEINELNAKVRYINVLLKLSTVNSEFELNFAYQPIKCAK